MPRCRCQSPEAKEQLLPRCPSARKQKPRMRAAPRSSSLPDRKTLSVCDACKSRKKPGTSQKSPPPSCPIVVVCAVPSPRLSPRGRARTRWDPSPKQRPKPHSCPCPCARPALDDLTKRLKTQIYGKEVFPPTKRRGRGCCKINCTAPCCLPVPKPDRKPVVPPRSLTLQVDTNCCISKCRNTGACAFAKNGKASYVRGMLSSVERKEKQMRQNRENDRLVDLLLRYSSDGKPSSCPSACVQRSGSNMPRSPTAVYGGCSALSSGSLPKFGRCRSTSGRRVCTTSSRCGRNFTQSSNVPVELQDSGTSTALCGRCQNPIEFTNAPSDRICKCEFALAPHCIRRMGPRSTVAEYLSTIEHPKPRFRPRRASTQSLEPAAGTSAAKITDQDQAMVASALQPRQSIRTSASGRGSLKGKKRRGTKSELKSGGATEGGTPAEEDGAKRSEDVQGNNSNAEVLKANENNNYGEDVSCGGMSMQRYYQPPMHSSLRFSSAPSYNYVPGFDTHYPRLDLTFNSSSLSSTAPYVSHYHSAGGYLSSVQGIRRNIREYYDSRARRLRASSAGYSDANLNAWNPLARRETPVSEHTSSVSPTKPSGEKELLLKRRDKKQSGADPSGGDVKIESSRVSRSPLKTRKPADVKVLRRAPASKRKTPIYSPRKSFVEGKEAMDEMFEDMWEVKKALNENRSKVMADEAGPVSHIEQRKRREEEIGSVEDLSVAQTQPTEQILESANDEAHGQSETNNVEGNDDNDKSEKRIESPVKDLNAPKVELKTNDNENRCSVKESSVDPWDNGQQPANKKISTLLNSVRKIEPRGAFLRSLVPDTPLSSMPASQVDSSESHEIKDISIADNADDLGASGNTKPEPVFQGFVKKFGETVQNFVRGNKISSRDPVAAEEHETISGVNSVSEKFESKASSSHAPETANKGGNTAQADEADTNKKKCFNIKSMDEEQHAKPNKRTAQTSETMSDCVSWSELVNAPPQVAPDPPAETIYVASESSIATTTAEQAYPVDKPKVVPNLSAVEMTERGRMLQAQNYEPLAVPDKTYALEVKISRTTKRRLHLDEPAPDNKNASVRMPQEAADAAISALKNMASAKSDGLDRNLQNSPNGLARLVPQRCGGDESAAKRGSEQDTPVDPTDDLGRNRASLAYIVNTVTQPFVSKREAGQGENMSNNPLIVHSAAAHKLLLGDAFAQLPASLKPQKEGDEFVGSSVDPEPGGRSIPQTTQNAIEDIVSKQPAFQKVSGCTSATMIMAAKSRFLKMTKGASVTNVNQDVQLPFGYGPLSANVNANTAISSASCSEAGERGIGGPFGAMICRSFDNCNPPRRQRLPLKVGSLTEAMKKFISTNGTPV